VFALERITGIAHIYLDLVIKEGDTVVDATAGNGHDALYLARKVGPGGHVYAFDIQKKALAQTASLLAEANLSNRISLIGESHTQISEHIKVPLAAAVYNLGYLPGGDHSIVTEAQTTIESIEQALTLIKPGGLITVTLYPGHLKGSREKDKLVSFCESLPPAEYTALHLEKLNRQTLPPELLVIQKKHF
jgi:predicted O-methyltransferase YrrM